MSKSNKSYVIYKRKHIIVVQSHSKEWGNVYYTIVNLKTNKHAHVDNYKAAVIVCNRATKNDIPKKYPKFLQNAIRRVI